MTDALILEQQPSTLPLSRLAAQERDTRRTIRWCIFLIFYFTLCDTILKVFPVELGTILRYLPEAILYLLVARHLQRRVLITSFPLFWPLLVCAATIGVSGRLNHSALFGMVSDFRVFFRFAAFSYLLWRTPITRRNLLQFADGFLSLTVVQLVVGAIEFVGGDSVKLFFMPALGWGSATAPIISNGYEQASWIAGTMANYNDYGFFMTISFVLAATLYFIRAKSTDLLLAMFCILAIVLSSSRHSVILLGAAVVMLLYFHRRRFAKLVSATQIITVLVCASLIMTVVSSTNKGILDRFTSVFSAETLAGDPQSNIRMFMIVMLAPQFLATYPFFGQGPIPPDEAVAVGDTNTESGPTLKAAPNMPGWLTYYLGDVVWLFILGLYGSCGVLAFWSVFAAVAFIARRVWTTLPDPATAAMAQALCIMAVLVLIAGFFSEEIIARDTVPIFWCLAGIIFSCYSHPVLPTKQNVASTGQVELAL